MSAIR